MKNLNNDQLLQLWNDYGAALLLGAGLLGTLALVGLLIYAKAKDKPLRRGALSFAMNLALLINAEGMWEFVTKKANFPIAFAVLVFAVFEICFITSTSLAAERYEQTTERDANGKVTKPGHPGKMLWVAFGIAMFSGGVVATTAEDTGVAVFRVGIPLMIFTMWWAALTAAGQVAARGRFAHSPRRIAERRGWIIGDDDPEFRQLAQDRAVKKIVIYGDRVRSNLPPTRLWKWRAARLVRAASEEVIQEVLAQLDRQDRFMDLIAPDRRTASGQNGLVLPPGVAVALPGGQTPTIERTDRRTEWTDDADARPLFEGVGDTDGPAAAAEQTPAEPWTGEPGARAPGTNGHRADTHSATTAGVWPLPQRQAAEHTAEPSEQTPEPVGVDSPEWRRAVESQKRPEVGSAQWLTATGRLSQELADTLRSEDMRGQSGRGAIELAELLAPKVPELDRETVIAFIGDYALATTGQLPMSGLPWTDYLPASEPVTALPDDELLRRFGEQLRGELRARGRLTAYRVGQLTRAGRRQSDRILDVILREHELSMSEGAR